MKKIDKGVVRKVEPRQVVKPTKAVVPRPVPVAPTTSAAADPVPPLPPALARALAHAAEPRAPARPVPPVAAPASDSLSAVKVFWATFGETRNAMGERITDWLGRHPELVVLDRKVTQSADSGFHCLTVTLFLGGDPSRYLSEPPEQKW